MTGNNKPRIVLQPRDRHLLDELSVMRVVDREQAKCVAGFRSTTRANARLLLLTRADLLRRFFIGTDAVGKKALYTLTPKGADLAGDGYRGLRRGRDEVVVGDFFVTHQLGINEIYCAVKYGPLPFPDAKFVRWLSFDSPLAPNLRLIPDGYLEITSPARSLAAFLELDLGHETLSVWRAKVEMYVSLATSGRFDEKFGQSKFRVLVVANSCRRMESLRKSTSPVTDKIFWFSDVETIRRDGFWSNAWNRPTLDERRPLLSIP